MNRRKFLASTGQGILGSMVVAHSSGALVTGQEPTSMRSGGHGRERLDFDAAWKFHLGDVPGAEASGFDDGAWEQLDLPHDWSIAGPFREENPSGPHGAYLPGGVGWYRKVFTLSQSDRERHVEIEFEGVYMNSEVWLNGQHLGGRPNGYVSFAYDLTPHLRFGDEPNVVVVKVDNSLQPNGRWYSGSGIYRHVWLEKTAPLHVDRWGTFIHARTVSPASAELEVTTRIRNSQRGEGAAVLVTRVLDASGQVVCEMRKACSVPGNAVGSYSQSLRLDQPHLWSPDAPALYTLVSQIFSGQTLEDEYETPFGVRSATFDPDRGFFLNGKSVKLKGVCIHHDLGALGAAFHEPAMTRRLRLLKDMGCNAIRMSHNPPAPQLLDMCDRMGFLVIDEAFDEWRVGKGGIPYGYHLYFDQWAEKDLTDMIERDRNHPSIILWSLGNEIPEKGKAEGVATAKMLVDIVHRLDASRPATCAINSIEGANKSGFSDVFDVVGYNGGGGSSFEYDNDHARYPHRIIYGSEAPHTAQTRGTYVSDENYCSSYDSCFLRMSSEGAWKLIKERPFVAGAFRWAGIDYLGEPIPHARFHTASRQTPWPARSGDFGVIDTCGFEKDIYYFYQSQWTDKPMLHILPHWNWEGMNGKTVFVWCYSNCDEVELFLNNRSLGIQHPATAAGYHLAWQVPYTPGVLRAIGKRDGKPVCTEEIRTAGAPARLLLSSESKTLRADGRDLAHVVVTVADANGVMAPDADHLIHFDVQGEGQILGVDNGDPLGHLSFSGRKMAAFRGKCRAVIQAMKRPGQITIRAHADGLEDGILVLDSSGSAG